MKKLFFIVLIVAAAVSSTAFFLFPGVNTLDEQVGLAISFAIVVPQLAAVWAFLTSLSAFKQQLKRAYYILAAGIVFLALTQLQLPLVSFIDIDRIAISWFITLSTLAGALLAYLSMHTFARVLELRVRFWSSFILVTVFALLLGFGSTLIPHMDFGISERVVDGIFGSYVTAAGYAIAAAFLALRIRARLATGYKVAMGWLAAGLALLAFTALHETAIRLFSVFYAESFAWYTFYSVSLWPFFLVSIFLTASSLSFKNLSREFAGIPENADYIEIINYVAQLASNPQEIDVTLDKVREITATTQAGSELSPDNKRTLMGVYLQLEAYLTTKEPLLKLTKEELRARLPEEFQRQLVRQ